MNVSKNRQFPSPTGPYKLSLKNTAPWRRETHARLQVSINNPGTEGEKCFALSEWAATRFSSVEWIVSDSLQRWNLVFADGMSMAQAWHTSQQAGDAWLKRNEAALVANPQAKITRWDDLLADPRFSPARIALTELADRDADFAQSLAAITERFEKSSNREIPRDRREAFFVASRDFLIEELAVFTFLCREPGIDVYAGSWLEPVFRVLAKHDDPLFDAFRKDWLQVDFTRNKGYQAIAQQSAPHPDITNVRCMTDRPESAPLVDHAGRVGQASQSRLMSRHA